MNTSTELYYAKRGKILVENLKKRHFDAYYCQNSEEALQKALELIPQGSCIGWGGTVSAGEIHLMEALHRGDYRLLDRDTCKAQEQRNHLMRECFFADWFITGANALSMDGQMVNIDGNGNRVAAIVYGPEHVLVIAGMNKVCDTLEAAMTRARTVAAPMNQQRFQGKTPCAVTGVCADCISDACICNQILITRNSRIPGRIKFLIVGENLGF